MKRLLLIIAATCLFAVSLSAQTAQEVAVNEVSTETTSKENKTTSPEPKPQVQQEGALSRWFEMSNFTISARYRNVSTSVGTPFLSQNQHREVLDAKFKFDRAGKYSVNAHVSSGYYFNWAYADSGWGRGTAASFPVLAHDMAPYESKDVIPGVVNATVQQILSTQFAGAPQSVLDQVTPMITAQVTAQVTPIVHAEVEKAVYNQVKDLNNEGWNLFVRQLYFSAKPIEGVEFQYGGIGINRGVNSEMTSYDDDGYLVGGRVSIKRPKNLFFDEVAITYAYLGDLFKPNFFRRTERMKQSNYHQFLVRKKIGTRAEASADYTFQDGVDIMREAVKVNVKETKVLDSLRVEMYQRLGDSMFPVDSARVFKSGAGFAVTGDKTIQKKVTLTGGYSQIDRDYTALNPSARPFGYAINGDRTGLGNRFFGAVKYQVAPEFSIDMYMSRPIKMNADEFTWNRNYLTAGFTFDALKMMQKAGWFK